MEQTILDPASQDLRTQIALLLDFYGNALTERQRRTAELYFQEDLSLAEIAEMTGITRQGVRDGLQKAEKSLFQLERDLGIAERFLRQRKILKEVRSAAEQLSDSPEKEQILSGINAVLAEA